MQKELLTNKKYLSCFLLLFVLLFFIVLSLLNVLEKITFPTKFVLQHGKAGKAVTINKQEKEIALTFDDGPGHHTEEILDILRNYDVKATFFVLGTEAQKNPLLLQRMNKAGHKIGNHTMNHRDLSRCEDAAEIKRQIQANEQIIMRETGKAKKIIRPPGGAHDQVVDQVIEELGYKMVLWNIDPRDWNSPTSEEIVERVVQKAKDGGIILLHDGGGNRKATVQALPHLIERLRTEGYRFITL